MEACWRATTALDACGAARMPCVRLGAKVSGCACGAVLLARVPVGGRRPGAGSRGSATDSLPHMNWNGQGESDCIIKTKNCDGVKTC